MKKLIFFTSVVAIIMLGACEDDNETTMTGTVKLSLTDAPLPMDTVEKAFVTLTRIEIRKKNNEDAEGENGGESDSGGPYVTIFDEAKEFNLADLRNGVTEELALVDVPVGNYDLVRLQMSDASLELKGGGVFDLMIPSGGSSGLKIFISPGLQVEGGITEELLLDFDLSRSLIPKGSLDDLRGFNFKPVIRAVNVSTSGRIVGNTLNEEDMALGDVEVWIEKDTVVSSTFSEESGFYALIGVPEGTFDLFAVKEKYDTLKIKDVKVTAGNRTMLNLVLSESVE